MTYTKNDKPKVYNIDFDHTLTADDPGTYPDDPAPEYNMIKAIQRIHIQGNIIIIWTARQWNNAPFLASWLTRYSVPYHGLKMEKGGSDVYLDDKMMSIGEFLK